MASTPATLRAMPRESIDLSLRYEGPDVNDGSMSIQDIVPVLQGFSNAYGKLARIDDPDATHRLRITGVRPGSAIIALDVWRTLAEAADPLTSISIMGGMAIGAVSIGYKVIKKIVGNIQIKKHVENKPFSERISQTGNIIINNYANVSIEVPLEYFELFKSGILDADLAKIVSPLVPGRIDSAEIEARAADGDVLRERITAQDRPSFDTTSSTVTTTARTWLVAKLNSLTKSTNGGWLYLNDGTRCYYSYKGEDALGLHQLFGSYDGPVRIFCEAQMDESLKVVSVDVYDIERLQGQLFAELDEPAMPSANRRIVFDDEE